MREQYTKAVFSLRFTYHFLNHVKKVEQKLGKTLHTNGVPQHYIAVLQILLLLKDNNMSTEEISRNYIEILGRGINQSSLSRTLTYLHETLNLIKYTDNPFAEDKRYTYVELTSEGKKLQKFFLGSTQEAIPSVFKSSKLMTAI
jgi:hypothetical protein